MEILTDPNAQKMLALGGGAVALLTVQGAMKIVQTVVDRWSPKEPAQDHDHSRMLEDIASVKVAVDHTLPRIEKSLDDLVAHVQRQNGRVGKNETELAVQANRLSVIENEMKGTGPWKIERSA